MEGKWIWLSCGKQEDIYGEFVADFHAETGAEYLLEISADSDYAIYLNDVMIQSCQYPDFPWYKVYDAIPLPSLSGDVKLRLIAYHGDDISFTHYRNKAGIRFSLLENGKPVLSSSENTPSRVSPYFVSGRKKLITWQLGYSFELDPRDSGEEFSLSVLEPELPETVYPRPIKTLQLLPKEPATELGRNVFDFEKETVGYPVIEATIQEGDTVTVSFGEWLSEEGKPMRRIGERDFSFVLRGNGKKTTYFHPIRKLGLRYLSFDGEIQIHSVSILPVLYPIEAKEAKLDTPLHQRIYDVSLRTLRLNMMEHYYDCPWREQSLYGLDSRDAMRYGYAAFEDTGYQKACLRLLSEDRHPSGLLSITVPTSHPDTIPSFALAYIIAMQEYLDATGDVSLARAYFGKMEGILTSLRKNAKDGLIGNPQGKGYWNFYEWMPHLDGEDHFDLDACMNLFYVFALRSLIRIGETLGRNVKDLSQEEAGLSDKIHEIFFDANRHAYTLSGGQHYSVLVNALALLAHIVPEEEREHVANHLVSPPNDFIPCTLSMKSFVYDALLEISQERYASFVLKDIDENYAFMLENGATSFWETIKGKEDFSGAGSLCHAWASLPLHYYSLLLSNY